MKNMILFAMAITLTSALASASANPTMRKMVCKGDITSAQVGNLASIEVQTEYMLNDRMKNVTATIVTDPDDGSQVQVGRRNQLERDANYKPRVYVGYDRYDFSKLIDISDFSDFMPGDFCQIQMLIPKDHADKKTFDAPLVISCDQSGGKAFLTCTRESAKDSFQ